LNSRENRSKFDDKADEGIFLRCSLTSKAYRVLNKRSRKIEETYYVTFDELYQSRHSYLTDTSAEIFPEGNLLTTPLLNLYEEFLNLFDEPETDHNSESGAKDNLEYELRKIIDDVVLASEDHSDPSNPIPDTCSEPIPIPSIQSQTDTDTLVQGEHVPFCESQYHFEGESSVLGGASNSEVEGENYSDVNSEYEEIEAQIDRVYDHNYPPLIKWTRDYPQSQIIGDISIRC